jgi:hypothetical protein
MAQPNLAPSKPKKKKIPKKPSQKQLAREKYTKRIQEFKVPFFNTQLNLVPSRKAAIKHYRYTLRNTESEGKEEGEEVCT